MSTVWKIYVEVFQSGFPDLFRYLYYAARNFYLLHRDDYESDPHGRDRQ